MRLRWMLVLRTINLALIAVSLGLLFWIRWPVTLVAFTGQDATRTTAVIAPFLEDFRQNCSEAWPRDGPAREWPVQRPLADVPPSQRIDIWGQDRYDHAYDVLANVCLDTTTSELFASDGPLVGERVSRKYMRGQLGSLKFGQADDAWWIAGTTVHVMMGDAGNIGHLVHDTLWPHIATQAWWAERARGAPCGRITFLAQGLTTRADADQPDARDTLGCARYPFFPWTRFSYADYALRTLIAASCASDAVLLHQHQFTLLPPKAPRLVCFERLETARDASDRDMLGPGRRFQNSSISLYRRTVMAYLGRGAPGDALASRLDAVDSDAPLRTLVYDRSDAPTRHLTNARGLTGIAENAFAPRPFVHTLVREMANTSFPEQADLFLNADVCLMPHGAHLTTALLLPRGAALVEYNSACDSRRRTWLGAYIKALALRHWWTFAFCSDDIEMRGNEVLTLQLLAGLNAELTARTTSAP